MNDLEKAARAVVNSVSSYYQQHTNPMLPKNTVVCVDMELLNELEGLLPKPDKDHYCVRDGCDGKPVVKADDGLTWVCCQSCFLCGRRVWYDSKFENQWNQAAKKAWSYWYQIEDSEVYWCD